MKLPRLPFSLALAAATIVTTLVMMPQPTQAAAVCLGPQTTGDSLDCGTGQVCEGGVPLGQCRTFSITLLSPSVTATSATILVDSNAVVNPTYQLYSCLGTSSVCGKPSSNPANWTNLGSTTGGNFTINNLRSGRTYTISYAGVFQGVESIQSQVFTTWPSPQPTVNVNSVTSTTASLSWSTPFSGTTEIAYGTTTPPQWYQETLPILASDRASIVSGSNAGQTWIGTALGHIFKRQSDGSWSEQTNPDQVTPPTGGPRGMKAMDVISDSTAWIGGLRGLTLRTTNGGTTWQALPLPLGEATDLYALRAATQATAWAGGAGGQIYFFNGTSWVKKQTISTGLTIRTIFPVSDVDVWVGGTNGQVVHSVDGGATWSAPTTLGTTSDIVYSIVGVNEQYLWASEGNGRLWRYSTSSGSWSPITNTTTGANFDLTPLGQNDIWFVSQNGIGHITNAAGATPVVTVDTSANTAMGQSGNSMSLVNGAHLFAIGNFSAYHFENRGNPQSGTNGTSHALTLSGLAPNRTYFYAVESVGASISVGMMGTFVTPDVDTVPPSISVTTPSGGVAYTRNNNFVIQGTISDNQNLSSLTCTNTTNATTPVVTTTPVLPYSAGGSAVTATWQGDAYLGTSDASNAVQCSVLDGTPGHIATANVTLVRDTIPPTITATTPGNFTCLNGYYIVNTASVGIGGTVNDVNPIDHLDYSLNGGPVVNIGAPSGTNWSTTVSGLATGPNNTVDVHAYDAAGNVATFNGCLDYEQPTFTLSVSPASQSKFVGDLVTYTVTATSVNGFSGPVTPSAVTGSPALVASFAPASINVPAGGSASTTMTINTTAASSGTYAMTVTGTSGALTDSKSVQLTLTAAPNFTLSATPSPLNIIAGNSSNYQVTVSSNNTFAGPISFSVSGLPSGVSGTFAPTSVTLGNSQTNNTIRLNIVTQPTVTSGDYTLTITGTGTNTATGTVITQPSTVILHIAPAPDLGLSFLPPSQTIDAGGLGTSYNGTVSSLSGFSGQVTLSVASTPAPSGLTLALAPTGLVLSVGGSLNTTLNVAADHSVPGGTYLLTITATGLDTVTGRTVTKTTTVNVAVNEDSAPPVISNIQALPNYNSVRITWNTDEPADSVIWIYADAARTTVVGTNSIAAFTLTHDVSYSPLNPLTTYYYSVSSTDTAPAPSGPHTATVTTDTSGAALQFTTLDTPDTEAPTIALDQPADSVPPTDVIGSVTVSGTARDNKNVASIHITINPGPIAVDTTLTCSGTFCSYSYNWSTTAGGPAGNGLQTITVVAQDSAGNLSTPVSRVVNVDNDYTAPMITDGPHASGLYCDPTKPDSSACEITITWTTDDLATSEVGYQIGPPYCDPVSHVCAYSDHQQYDEADRSNASPDYTLHQVKLRNLSRNSLYHYRVFSCNRSSLCYQGN